MEEESSRRGRARGRARGALPGVDSDVVPGAAEGEYLAMEIGGQQRLGAAAYREMYGTAGSEERAGSEHSGGERDGRQGRGQSRGFRTEQPDFIATRPQGLTDKKGSSGQAREFLANYFELQTKKAMAMQLHHAAFTPEIDELYIKKALLREKETEIGPYLFDGAQLFTTKAVPEEYLDFEAKYKDKPDVYRVKISYIRDVHSLEPLAFQLYNILVRKCQVLLELDLLGRYYFDRAGKVNDPQLLSHRLEMWPGFITSMRQQEKEILLNVDITFKVIRTESVFQIMRDIRNRFPDDFKAQCEAAIIGTIVMTRYNRKTYRVDRIDWEMKATDTFLQGKKEKAQPVSFVDYYMKKYNVEIANRNQPLLISRPKARDIRREHTDDVLLVPELCFQTGLNEELRSNFRLMRDLANHLHMTPERRLQSIKDFMQRIQDSQQIGAELMRWGVRFKSPLVEVQGRQLPKEAIGFQQGSEQPDEKGDWSMAFRSKKMFTAKVLKNWVIICSARDGANIDNLIGTMQRVATPLGYQINRPSDVIRLPDVRAAHYKGAISDAMGKLMGKIDMIMCILPNNRLDTYAEIKKTCALQYGIPSQCFLGKHLSNTRGLMSICTKLVIQMNAKQGGEPWTVQNPLKGLMVVGFDVYHGGGKSYGAMVASMTGTLATYFSTICEQEPGMEMSAGVGAALNRCILAFAKNNEGRYPVRIMFYRDGVGEGQLIFVNRTELTDCKNVIKSLYSSAGQELPKLTFIVVTKRINTRLFINTAHDVRNPLPGTVVDDRITCPERYDFFLVPHSVRQGTISPVNFNVLMDRSGLDADKIQRFTYKLCHMYFNWSGTVAVPAPCQLAHKLAFLTGTALQREAHHQLSNLLHFL